MVNEVKGFADKASEKVSEQVGGIAQKIKESIGGLIEMDMNAGFEVQDEMLQQDYLRAELDYIQ